MEEQLWEDDKDLPSLMTCYQDHLLWDMDRASVTHLFAERWQHTSAVIQCSCRVLMPVPLVMCPALVKESLLPFCFLLSLLPNKGVSFFGIKMHLVTNSFGRLL